MNNKVYVWHPKYNDFWLVEGIERHWLLGICYIICDRNYQKKEYKEVRQKGLLTNEGTVARFDIRRLSRRYRNQRRLNTLPSGDQPSLLIED